MNKPPAGHKLWLPEQTHVHGLRPPPRPPRYRQQDRSSARVCRLRVSFNLFKVKFNLFKVNLVLKCLKVKLIQFKG